MLNAITLVVSSLGVGGLLGVFTKSVLDKRQLRFSKVFEYKERPELADSDKLDRELELEYHNMMIYASDEVLTKLRAFIDDKSQDNWKGVTRAMKRGLYL